MAITEFTPDFVPGARIKVFGVGGAGCNTITRMVVDKLEGVEFVAVNTDAQALANNPAHTKLHIGINVTRGLGAGANPEVGRKAAEESAEEIKKQLVGSDMVFITAGMGGGTGTGGAPVIAQIAREMGILTVGVVTKPFSFEGKSRFQNASEGFEKMKASCDTLIAIPNDKIFNIVDKKTTFNQAFLTIDKILRLGVQGITDLIIKPGLINIDFADVKVILSNSGNALLGIGYGEGENRAVEAARKAIDNHLMENRLTGAKNIIFAVTGGNSVTPMEVREAASIVEEIADPDARIIWGMTIDEDYGDDEIKITIIATGFIGEAVDSVAKTPARDRSGRKIKTGGEDFVGRLIKDEQVNRDSRFMNGLSSGNNNPFHSTPVAEPQQPAEDLDTPAFMRRKLS
ncbi:MAG TPA: cell division protein FtsZ [Candidatus Absconditabacterales bacterium]|nr:cell division protein FtsZ [Candidatus Absconditabacterales bacterium]HNG96918.1 cell division protein FtsZ [Candidatus Absconditabacterales bacterium]